MTSPSDGPEDKGRRGDEAYWAHPISRPKLTGVPTGAVNLNVEGRQVVARCRGSARCGRRPSAPPLTGATATPLEVVQVVKESFPKFQPRQNRFYPSLAGVKPGEVVLIDAMTPAGPVSTGVLVLYADEESFTFMTPQGHPEAGWVTFSAAEEEGTTVAYIQTLGLANDPLYEVFFRAMGSRMQDRLWTHVLIQVAAHFGANAKVVAHKVCLDRRVQWRQAKNVWYNAGIRTVLTAPYWMGRRRRR